MPEMSLHFDVARLRTLGILPTDDRPPFDIIGDVHGCVEELRELLGRLGYSPSGPSSKLGSGSQEGYYRHPDGRRIIFVGDLVDRGPGNIAVLEMALDMRAAGVALQVLGNHDARFLRWLSGRSVRTTFGLAQTIAELNALPDQVREAMRRRIRRLFEDAPGYLILDERRLVVTHGGIRDRMIGAWDGETAAYCLYGDVEGYTHSGKPIRRDWAAHRHIPAGDGGGSGSEGNKEESSSLPYIIYGHNVVQDLRWVNRTIDLDTGCVYGGRLSALRYPELELVTVDARQAYARRG
jgi:protein phosphatase